jgi:hypothetical protein
MSDMDRRDRAREALDDLLVKQATMGLDADETRELNRLLAEMPEVDPGWAERVVGELDAATVADVEAPLPDGLRAALIDAGPAVESAPERRRSGLAGWAGWAVAAALGALWLGRAPEVEPLGSWDTVAAAEDAVVATWEPGGDAVGDRIEGEIVWSSERQEGVMRFAGLAPNPPEDFQYQLWIFDEDRDARYPVDGGVFDVPDGEGIVEVPIRARLPIEAPTLYAVTLERPGGVVVSDRSRIATLARVAEG